MSVNTYRIIVMASSLWRSRKMLAHGHVAIAGCDVQRRDALGMAAEKASVTAAHRAFLMRLE